MALPTPDERRAVRTIYRDDEPMAALMFDRSLEDERELLDAVAATAGIALENGRLRAELRARLQELQGSRVRVFEASRQERQRLERDLHDGAQQRLVALSLELGMLVESTTADAAVRQRLARAKNEVSASLEELRDVARGIYPAVLSGHGLAVALESSTARAAVPVELVIDFTDRLPAAVEVAAYYVVSEALTNIDKHAHGHVGDGTGQPDRDERRGRHRRRRCGWHRDRRGVGPPRSGRPGRGARRPVPGLDARGRRHPRPRGDPVSVTPPRSHPLRRDRRGQRAAA